MTLKDKYYFIPKTILQIIVNNGIPSAIKFIRDYNFLKKDIRLKIAETTLNFQVKDPGVSYQKYLDTNYWVFISLRRAYQLKLETNHSKKNILDLGTGAGYFPYICNYYGHNAESLDVPDNPMYNEIIEKLGITRYTEYIMPFKSLSISKKYDLITGFMICFNNHKQKDLWQTNEWKYFLSSLREKNLNQFGVVFLSFNPESDEIPIQIDLINYFKSINSEIKGTEFTVKESNIEILKNI